MRSSSQWCGRTHGRQSDRGRNVDKDWCCRFLGEVCRKFTHVGETRKNVDFIYLVTIGGYLLELHREDFNSSLKPYRQINQRRSSFRGPRHCSEYGWSHRSSCAPDETGLVLRDGLLRRSIQPSCEHTRPIKRGDTLLANREILSYSVNFSMRSSFVFLPE